MESRFKLGITCSDTMRNYRLSQKFKLLWYDEFNHLTNILRVDNLSFLNLAHGSLSHEYQFLPDKGKWQPETMWRCLTSIKYMTNWTLRIDHKLKIFTKLKRFKIIKIELDNETCPFVFMIQWLYLLLSQNHNGYQIPTKSNKSKSWDRDSNLW